jgi:hypothetical protein
MVEHHASLEYNLPCLFQREIDFTSVTRLNYLTIEPIDVFDGRPGKTLYIRRFGTHLEYSG